RIGLSADVEFLVSGDDVASPKPDPEGVRKVLDEFGVAPAELLLVGDSPSDIQAGRLAGTKTGAALWGAFDPAALRKEGATWQFAKVEDLHKLIEQWRG